jgi:glycosylphosphatidylinositol transamidase
MSNLLERLHASFFLYIMTTPSSFLKIGSYLPSAVVIAVALMFGGLQEWVNAGWVEIGDGQQPPEKGKVADIVSTSKKTWVRRRRDLLDVFVVMAASHLVGLTLFVVISHAWFDISQLVCSSVLVTSYHLLMSISELRSPACMLDNTHVRPGGHPLRLVVLSRLHPFTSS